MISLILPENLNNGARLSSLFARVVPSFLLKVTVTRDSPSLVPTRLSVESRESLLREREKSMRSAGATCSGSVVRLFPVVTKTNPPTGSSDSTNIQPNQPDGAETLTVPLVRKVGNLTGRRGWLPKSGKKLTVAAVSALWEFVSTRVEVVPSLVLKYGPTNASACDFAP